MSSDIRGLASADEKTREELQKPEKRQEHRIRKDCQKQAAEWRGSFSIQRVYIRDWQKRRTKIKSDAR
jgi:hypothetical protein